MDETLKIIIVLLTTLLILPFILCFIDNKIGTSYSCTIFGWHDGNSSEKSFDGCSVHAQCSKCGKNVMQDGQGNWF